MNYATSGTDYCPTCGQSTTAYSSVTNEIGDLIGLLDEILKAPRKNWFIPKRTKMIHLHPPALRLKETRHTGSGWKKHNGHFILRIC